jgi:hypothetical protein
MLEFNSAKRPLDEEIARLEAQDKILLKHKIFFFER